ncbi:syntaxin-binding protein-like protein 2 [Venturia nashicola]|uniref:Syntaxin-binding protein-like protein 2 n=1 Tax=Venturia nashicola TaxID=86259 RepID=A0A4Z1PJ91_9PEZI|nr:syntaxin-binding protein-like protein 2 [Venturia nashicola]TLD37934.1 syntaxin-binding protein-like protein 2 [Venturia nashicola]
MALSMLQTQRDEILKTIRDVAKGEWKVLVVDEDSRKVLDNVVKEDDILNENITNVEQIDQKRPMNPDMDAVYILSPLPYIVDCLMADFERRRYKNAHLLWTSILPPALRQRIDKSAMARPQIHQFRVLNLEFFPREAQLITFRDPYSFPVLYHPACSSLVRQHIAELAQKIVAVCVTLGEYPIIRFYQPRNPQPTHEAHILSGIIARAVQEEIDNFARWNEGFPPPSNRPRGTLYILDRSLDLFAPLLHEFTYQAMAHDLLPIQEGDKITYTMTINEGKPNEEIKDMEISEKDKLWVENRHRHMKDTLDQLSGDFAKFIAANPHFANADSDGANLNVIKDMIAGLPQFQQMKDAYSLHLAMASDSMAVFQTHKLPDIASLEQSLATGLDEDYKKPKNLGDQVVRMLDEAAIVPDDRLRLIALYILHKEGLLRSDINLLSLHARLQPQDQEMFYNLELLGARVFKQLKDAKPPSSPMFPAKPPPAANNEEDLYALSRFETNVKQLLDHHVAGTLDPITFPFVRPELSAQPVDANANISSASLRSAKPTWAKAKISAIEPRQRVIVFMAGGAMFSESRACYEVSAKTSRDVILVTSHMLTPNLFIRQVKDLSADRRSLHLPADRAPRKAPAFLFEEEKPKPLPKNPMSVPAQNLRPPPPPQANVPQATGPAVPTKQMGAIKLDGGGKDEKEKKHKEKKKHHFFGSKKDKS